MNYVLLSSALAVFLVQLVSNVTCLETEKIIHGNHAKKNQFPYNVYLRAGYSNATGHMCGGALIAPNIVLTAAHCVYDRKTATMKDLPQVVFAGTVDIHVKGPSIAVSKIYSHKQFQYHRSNDIAVLRLEKSFDVSDQSPIKIIKLPNKSETFLNKIALETGFGDDTVTEIFDRTTAEKFYTSTSDGKMKYAFVKVKNSEECQPFGNQLCGELLPGPDGLQELSSFGDSGSPLVYRNKVIGIVSHGTSNNYEGSTVYAKVSHFIDFIQGAMDDRPTDDTLVKSIEGYRHFEFARLDLDITTKSPRLIAALERFKQLLSRHNIMDAEYQKLREKCMFSTSKQPDPKCTSLDAKGKRLDAAYKQYRDAQNEMYQLLDKEKYF